MDRKEIIRLFEDNIGIHQLMSENEYEVSTRCLMFNYDGANITIENVSLVCFTEDRVWFNDEEGYLMEKMNGHFGFDTRPSETVHPMVMAFHKVKGLINAFGMEV